MESTIKKRRKRPGTGALMEMRKLQKYDKNLLPKAPFRRLVHQVVFDQLSVGSSIRIQSKAFDALLVSASSFLHHIFVLANSFCVNNNRLKVTKNDFIIASNIISGRYRSLIDIEDASKLMFTPPVRSLSASHNQWKQSAKTFSAATSKDKVHKNASYEEEAKT
ncbi:histone H3 [Cymbomonas tetramitiformis]|uniref:Histone H3 n=1 Tax=Cymbomonas tetramitiformis TaxID=36881 RepID=A0AAE0EQ03_9CHLO|nr:histone H3 [Cymbomonas tetramitiformis]